MINRSKLFDIIPPLSDGAISSTNLEDAWNIASITVDGVNVLDVIWGNDVSSPIVHLKTVEYNASKLIYDIFDENKSTLAKFADALNLTGSIIILGSDGMLSEEMKLNDTPSKDGGFC